MQPHDDPATVTAIAHLYRGEMNRMTVWRQRLDITSNWAILISMGLTTFSLGAPAVPHFILLLGASIVAISLFLEAQRYRHLHHSRWRLRQLEAGYFSPLLSPSTPPDSSWREKLAEDLNRPSLRLSLFDAIRTRLRRDYLLLFYFLTAVWATKIFIHPASPATVGHFMARLAVGDVIPSWVVAASVSLFVVAITALAVSAPSPEKLEGWSETRKD